MSLKKVLTEILHNFIVAELDQVSKLALRGSCEDLYNRIAPTRARKGNMPKMTMAQLLWIEQWQIYDKCARGVVERVKKRKKTTTSEVAQVDAANTSGATTAWIEKLAEG